MSNEKTKWVRFQISNVVAYYLFNHRPAKADVAYNKPAMYKAEAQLTEDSVLSIEGDNLTFTGIKEIRKALKGIYVPVYDLEGTVKATNEDWERHNIVKFQSKVKEPEDAVKRKPVTVDAAGEPFPDNILIGNGSVINIRGALPDYRVTGGLKPGRKPSLPTFEGLQVVDLIQYIAPEGQEFRGNSFKPVEGYTNGSAPSKTVTQGDKPLETEDDDTDVFETLGGKSGSEDIVEQPTAKRVEPAPITSRTVKKKV